MSAYQGGPQQGCVTSMAQSKTVPAAAFGILSALALLAVLLAATVWPAHLHAQEEEQGGVDDASGKYHFLSPDDTLAILDEEGKLKGYIEVTQPDTESDDIISYDIVDGSRTKNHLQFHTNKIHEKYYRFSGTVTRGKGHDAKDSDYLHIIGDLDVVTINSETGKEAVQVQRVIFKSIGKAERPDDE